MPRSGSRSTGASGMPGAGAGRRRAGGARDPLRGRSPRDVSARAGIAGQLARRRERQPAGVEAALDDRDVAVGGDPPDDRAGQAPAGADVLDPPRGGRAGRSRPSAPGDSLIITSKGSMPGSRRGIASRSTTIPVPARSAVSQTPQVMPAAPRSWSPSTRPALDELEGRLDEELLGERVADLDGGPLRGILVAEGRAGEDRRAADPVASGRRCRRGRRGSRVPAPRPA